MFLLSLLGLAFMGTALTESTVATNWREQTQAFYVAEAGIESGLAGLKALLIGSPTPTDPQLLNLNTSALPTLSDANLAANFRFSKFTVKRVRPTLPYSFLMVIDSGSYRGLNAFTTDYQITAEATGPRGARVKLNQVMRYLQVPLFQFGAFYGKGVDFETYAGPTFKFTGRVHANSNIHLSDSGSNGMFFDSFVTATGGFYRRRKDEASPVRAGNPDIKDGSGNYQKLDFDREVNNISSDGSTWTPSGIDYWRDEALKRFGGKVLDGAHGVQEIIPPVGDLFYNPAKPDVVAHQMIEKGNPGDTPAMKASKLYYQADLRIVNGVATRKDGSSVSLPAGVITPKSFWDNREKKPMTITQVDVAALKANLSTIMPSGFNGVLYVSDDAANTGVRLANGAELPSMGGGFTVISENPVYVQGDYNIVNKVPAAVMADAITVLSNKWGEKDPGGKTYDDIGDKKAKDRPASATMVNAALAMGPNAESKPDAGNGEFNNLVRFLEDWDGAEFKYSGSMVALWHSMKATAPWLCCDENDKDHYYTPPTRIWSYDTLFNTSLPPGTPYGIVMVKGRWWQE
jgi:hypothetical protein